MVSMSLIPVEEFGRVSSAPLDEYRKIGLLADMCRVNTLTAVKRAGSGHLGTSLSSMDIMAWLYWKELNTVAAGLNNPNRDIFFSSKGHDVPGLYSMLHAHRILPTEKLLQLRRYGGLDGHPQVGIPGIECNSGSLGMGISKGRGMAWSKRFHRHAGRVFVLTGDGELQEGQNYEAFQAAVHQHIENLIVIVDHNKVQSDKPVEDIMSLGELETRIKAFGWETARCNGHDFRQIETALARLKTSSKPKLLIADTLKGAGVSFMEHPKALQAGRGLYPWHSGAPNDEAYTMAMEEVIHRINSHLGESGLKPLALIPVQPHTAETGSTLSDKNLLGEPVSEALARKMTEGVSKEYVAEAFGNTLVELASRFPKLVVLDADLSADCRVRKFETTYPDRFIENGIAEQDMVSMAGGLARQGLLPVVNSFASFLASRANEQIYNNASEQTKIIYACHYAGLIPAGPGKSHQSIRDISLFGALPNCEIIQPANSEETAKAVEYAVSRAPGVCMLRLVIGPSPRIISLPPTHTMTPGHGTLLREGKDRLLIAYGPVMLHEALLASELLSERGIELAVLNMPWLNRLDMEWWNTLIGSYRHIFILEDHAPVGGLADFLLAKTIAANSLGDRTFRVFAVEGWPAMGTPSQVLHVHGLDGLSLARRIVEECPAHEQ